MDQEGIIFGGFDTDRTEIEFIAAHKHFNL